MNNWNILYRSVTLTVFLVVWADSFRISHFTVRTCPNVVSSVGAEAQSPLLLLLMWLTVDVLLVVDVLLLWVMLDIHLLDRSDWLYWQCLEQLRLVNYTLSAVLISSVDMNPPQYTGLCVCSWSWKTYFRTGFLYTRTNAVIEAQKKLGVLVQINEEVDWAVKDDQEVGDYREIVHCLVGVKLIVDISSL